MDSKRAKAISSEYSDMFQKVLTHQEAIISSLLYLPNFTYLVLANYTNSLHQQPSPLS